MDNLPVQSDIADTHPQALLQFQKNQIVPSKLQAGKDSISIHIMDQQRMQVQQSLEKLQEQIVPFQKCYIMKQQYYKEEFVLIKFGILQNFLNLCQCCPISMHFQLSKVKQQKPNKLNPTHEGLTNQQESPAKKSQNEASVLMIEYNYEVFFDQSLGLGQRQEILKTETIFFQLFVQKLHEKLISELLVMQINIGLNSTGKKIKKYIKELVEELKDKF